MTAPRPDGELLAAFAGHADQAAFAELVERHGPMVLRVAEAILRDRHGAEDVAQATFLVLARKAAGLRQSESVAPWLHRVAWRLAVDELRRRQRRQAREEENVRMNTPASPADLSAVHEELGALPDRYRNPLVVCYLEGEPQDSAARRLGLSAEALRKRLERGRELLRQKLVRRGGAVGSAGALTVLLSAESGAATLPATFVASTVGAATGTAAVPASVAVLTKGALNMIFWSQIKLVAVVVATTVVLTSTGVVVGQKVANNPGPANPGVDARLLLVEAQKRMKDQRLFEAIPLFEQAWANAQDDGLRAEILYWLGEAHQRAGNGDEAIRCWKELTWQYPSSTWAKFGRGKLAQAVPPVAENAGSTPVAATAPVPAATGNPGNVFKPIDQTQSGTYGDGKWGYHYVVVADGPQKGYRQGFLKYDGRDLLNPPSGDYIVTPWGWMQWQDRQPAAGNWLPVAEKPATGKQLPDPATHPEIISRPPPSP
jgi:RNA polymerase sigma factor (sigma-70 family)